MTEVPEAPDLATGRMYWDADSPKLSGPGFCISNHERGSWLHRATSNTELYSGSSKGPRAAVSVSQVPQGKGSDRQRTTVSRYSPKTLRRASEISPTVE